jgi:hypothetical protein
VVRRWRFNVGTQDVSPGSCGIRGIGEEAQDSRPGIFSAVPFDKLRAGSAGLVLVAMYTQD